MPDCDGIHAMAARGDMAPGARKIRDFYDLKPGAPFYHKEFGFYCLERWHEQGLERDADFDAVFGYDPQGIFSLGGLGWCEAGFAPEFDIEVLEDRGDYELVQDHAGRGVLYFKGRRDGFMPEYVTHPVCDIKTFTEKCLWRMDPNTPGRWTQFDALVDDGIKKCAQGYFVTQRLVGGYMYLRSLWGPEALLYAFYDQPKAIHACMQAWFTLADAVIARHQAHFTLDEIFLAEDICYNHGPLISPDMMREFLIPYYQQLITNARARQIDKDRHMFVQIDTDGFCDPVLDVYIKGIGMDAMSPFEVAAGCSVMRTAQEYPFMRISGGIDKRVLATTPDTIDRYLEAFIPQMRARGGFIPTCDHGVPEEVSLANYMHYRKRMLEYGG